MHGKDVVKSGEGIFKIGKLNDKRLIWDDAKAFLAVARAGTLSAAAEQMGVGIATLSRRVERLEEALGAPLFVRQQSGYQMTEDGTALVPAAEAMEAAAYAMRAGCDDRITISGTVRLATAENLATALILPALPALRQAHPALTVEIVTDIATVNLHRRDADLALRMVRPERGNVILQRLGVLGYGLYGSRDYLEAHTAAPDAAGYDTHDFVGWGEAQGHLGPAQWVERILQGRAPAVTTTSLSTQIAAVRAGLGLAALPHFLAREAGLTCIDGDLGLDQAIYLVVQSDLAQAARVEVVAHFLRNLVQGNKDMLSGG
ncbi:LysR family transcriptional regulator [Rhodovulum imhoffii]|nr:LysR family transcriptional regulator [Rhodovulum imhoffii]MBK5933704.1 LysR family transcriptional regulator [Rhodovulum imhoffii]